MSNMQCFTLRKAQANVNTNQGSIFPLKNAFWVLVPPENNPGKGQNRPKFSL